MLIADPNPPKSSDDIFFRGTAPIAAAPGHLITRPLRFHSRITVASETSGTGRTSRGSTTRPTRILVNQQKQLSAPAFGIQKHLPRSDSSFPMDSGVAPPYTSIHTQAYCLVFSFQPTNTVAWYGGSPLSFFSLETS
jgi:hypothetical protein